MTYALFPQVGISFIENRNNPDFFEAVPQASDNTINNSEEGTYTVLVKGTSYTVDVSAGGDITSMKAASDTNAAVSTPAEKEIIDDAPIEGAEEIGAPLSGNIWKSYGRTTSKN